MMFVLMITAMIKKINGYLTIYLEKFLGFKGISFCLGWAGFWTGLIPWSWEFVVFNLTLCGFKVGEDLGRQYLNNNH